ncbi:hypothetical protein ACIQCF_07585 [Streptomyces sp. NPDC088353]|uniref:hypothetical protein n=1 Tax=Streptomyces sp. NPDC088353 TaxID=3365855 RepID=UPI00381BED52
MSQFITALVGAGAAVGVGSVMVVRSWPQPRGRHRALAAPRQARALAGALPGPSPQAAPVPPHGAVVAQSYDDCPTCARATAGMLHKTGWTCGTCFTSVIAGGAA